MGFPSDRNIMTPAEGWVLARRESGELKESLTQHNDAMAAQGVSVAYLIGILNRLTASVKLFSDVKAIPNIVAYAQDQMGEPARDFGKELDAMIAACTAAETSIIRDIPKDPSRHMQERTISESGEIVEVTLTTAQTANVRTDLAAVIATID